MLKQVMAVRPSLIPLLAVLTFAGCSKGPSTGKVAEPTWTAKVDLAETCDAALTKSILGKITAQENEVARLDTAAKGSPKKENFRKLFDAETEFLASTEAQLKRLTSCGAPADALSDVKNKVAKSRADVTYLSESFSDFK